MTVERQTCSVNGCDLTAVACPVLEYWPKGSREAGRPPIQHLFMGLALCDGHGADVAIHDLVTSEEAWESLQLVCLGLGAPLDRETMRLMLQPIGEPLQPGKTA